MSGSLLLVFNELSVPEPPQKTYEVTQWLERFFDILLDPRCGTSRILATPPNFLQYLVTESCTLGRWLKTYRGDEVKRRRISLLIDKRRDFATFDLKDDDVEYRYSGRVALGLSLAHCESALAISFCSEEQWNVPAVSVEKSWATETDVETRALNVPHASRPLHLDFHGERLKLWTTGPVNGNDLWARKAELFPQLDFCDSVEPQICALNGGEQRFKVTCRGLADLQSYCESWNTPNFDIHHLGNSKYASGESQTTLNMYSRERTIRCPDGEDRLFQWHLKKGDTRIHFFDFPNTKRLLIGYVGGHLPI